MSKTGVVIAAGGGRHGARWGRGRGRRLHGSPSRGAVAPEHEELVTLLRERGGYDLVEVGYEAAGGPSVASAVQSVIKKGASRVVVVPAGVLNSNMAELVGTLQRRYRDVQISYTGQPVDTTRYADWILTKVREYDPEYVAGEAQWGLTRLGSLAAGETAVINDLDAGHTLMSRLSALGFTPGAKVQMIQNFGHGPVIVCVRDTRIALGRGEAAKIRVRRAGNGE